MSTQASMHDPEAATAPAHTGLEKEMRWWDGFALSLTMPAALIATLGASIAGLGAWGAVALWAISMLLATAANWIYSELALMFPEASGGIPSYAAEAWRSRAPWVGAVAAFGYWFAWTTALSVYAGIIGSLVQTQWFPGQDWSIDIGPLLLNFPIVVGLLVVVLLYAANMTGLRIALWVVYGTGLMLLVPLAIFILGPLLSGDLRLTGLEWKLEGMEGLRTAIVWLYVMAWTSFGVEVAASFAPEYRDTKKDTPRALRAAALFSLGIFVLLPLTLSGYLGEAPIAADPTTFYIGAFQQLVGGAADVMVVFLIGSLLLIMITGLADGSRVLYAMGKDGTTIRWVGVLNDRGIPARAFTVALVINVLAITILKTPLAIVVTGNLGYILTHILALSGFLLLRHDRPEAERPIRLPAFFVGVAWFMVVALVVILAVGATGFSITGYGGIKELLIALGVMATGVGLWAYRTYVQDAPTRPVTPAPAPEDPAANTT